MKTIAIVCTVLALTACSTYKVGAIAFIPHGQYGTLAVGPTLVKAASAP